MYKLLVITRFTDDSATRAVACSLKTDVVEFASVASARVAAANIKKHPYLPHGKLSIDIMELF